MQTVNFVKSVEVVTMEVPEGQTQITFNNNPDHAETADIQHADIIEHCDSTAFDDQGNYMPLGSRKVNCVKWAYSEDVMNTCRTPFNQAIGRIEVAEEEIKHQKYLYHNAMRKLNSINELPFMDRLKLLFTGKI